MKAKLSILVAVLLAAPASVTRNVSGAEPAKNRQQRLVPSVRSDWPRKASLAPSLAAAYPEGRHATTVRTAR